MHPAIIGVIASSGPVSSAPPVVLPTPTAMWLMDETSGTTFVDSQGSHDASIFGGVTLAQTALAPTGAHSAQFDGTTGYATIPDDPALRAGTGEYAIEMWLNYTSSNIGILFGKFNLTAPYTGVTLFSNFTGVNNLNGIIALRDTADAGYVVTAGRNVSGYVPLFDDGVTRHIIAQRRNDGGTWKLQILIDGVLYGDLTLPSVTDLNTSEDAFLGSRPTGSQYCNGNRDNVKFYVGVSFSEAQAAAAMLV